MFTTLANRQWALGGDYLFGKLSYKSAGWDVTVRLASMCHSHASPAARHQVFIPQPAIAPSGVHPYYHCSTTPELGDIPCQFVFMHDGNGFFSGTERKNLVELTVRGWNSWISNILFLCQQVSKIYTAANSDRMVTTHSEFHFLTPSTMVGHLHVCLYWTGLEMRYTIHICVFTYSGNRKLDQFMPLHSQWSCTLIFAKNEIYLKRFHF